ncbi:MAG TPA: ABC transporter ATP-binding protein [Vicinamibacterales bacterium]|jgi:ATP-binding cassette subfamily C protein|nr:ABC transporter ATP-binding protein [Vicinamibacterales bacterium]
MLETLRKSAAMVSPATKRRWFAVLPLSLLSSAAEMATAMGLFALLKLLGSGSVPGRARIVQTAGVLAVVFLLKTALVLWTQYARIRVAHDAAADVAASMLRRYLSAPYPFHIRRNSAELIRNLTSSMTEVLGGVLAGSTAFATDALVGAGLAVVIVLTSPAIAVTWVAVLSATMAIVLRVTRTAAARFGATTYESSAAVIQSLQEPLAGIKELKVLGREGYFYDAFRARHEDLRRAGYLAVTLDAGSSLTVQAVLFCGVLALVVVLTLAGRPAPELLATAGVFGYAGLRMLPLAQSLVTTVNAIRSRRRWVDELYADFLALEDSLHARDAARAVTFEREIALRGVSFTYPGGGRPAVDGVSIAIRKGESVGIVGPTGAGKSTLVDLLLGLLPPSTGTIAVDGIELTGADVWRRRVGYVPQSLFMIDDTLRRNVALGIPDGDVDDRRILEVLRMSQLAHFLAELPQGLDTRVGERGVRLSGGERQRLAIARALYHDPDLLVFDEATSALDLGTEAEVTRAIDGLRGRKTTIVISHRLTSVANCDRLVWVRSGRVEAEGTFQELRRLGAI